jgi:hypothetical protein
MGIMIRKETLFVCEYQDLEAVMESGFGHRVSWLDTYPVDNHPGNDSVDMLDATIPFDWLGATEEVEGKMQTQLMAEIEAWVASLHESGYMPRNLPACPPGPESVLSYMVLKGWIEPGKYVIEICW